MLLETHQGTRGKYPRAVMTSVITALGWFFHVFVCLFYGTLGNIFFFTVNCHTAQSLLGPAIEAVALCPWNLLLSSLASRQRRLKGACFCFVHVTF